MSAASAPAVSQSETGVRKGSRFSDKQIAKAVLESRAVEVSTGVGDPVIGFVYGMDDFHIGLVTARGDTMLVHKSAPLIRFVDSVEISAEAEEICAAFRNRVARENYSQTTATA